MHEALLYERLDNGYVKCNLCGRRCIIAPGKRGVCLVRYNREGKLYSLVYGKLTAMNVDPIEKKPLFHVWPGSYVYSISTFGCNFRCVFCDNYEISQPVELQAKLDTAIKFIEKYSYNVTPEDVVKAALRTGSQGIAYTYNEPTVFYEFMLDTAKLAVKHGLFNVIVTNGYMTPEALDELAPYLLAATVDFKASGDPAFYKKYMGVPDVEPIFQFLEEAKRKGVFIEITDLIVPEFGDNINQLRKLCRWIIENLGPETPFHIIKFFPCYQLSWHYSTPIETLEKMAKIAREEGLKYVYVGNVPGHDYESTYCPECGYLLIKRAGFYIINANLSENMTCPKCGSKINIIGKVVSRKIIF